MQEAGKADALQIFPQLCFCNLPTASRFLLPASCFLPPANCLLPITLAFYW